MKYSAIVLAGGSGSRTGLTFNKVLYPIAQDKVLLDLPVQTFLEDPDCAQVVIASAKSDLDKIQTHFGGREKICITQGGATRQQSVYQALQAVSQPWVLIHDGARPFLSAALLENLKETLEKKKACLLAKPVKDTIKVVDEHGQIVDTPVRAHLRAAQTPQAFLTADIMAAHEKARSDGLEATDDAQIAEAYLPYPVFVVDSDDTNEKITSAADIEQLVQRLKDKAADNQ